MNRILLIEDDRNMAMGLVFNLKSEGFEVTHCLDGETGLAAMEEQVFDILVLDWMLPGVDGLEVLRRLRGRNVSVPVLLLTARDSKEDIVEGLDSGADDYLAKPFDLNILMARIRSLLRSRAWLTQKETHKDARFGNAYVNFETFEATIGEKQIRLSYKEAMIMKLFWEKRNQVITREELLQKVWGIEGYIQSRTVDNHIVQLRKIFEENPKIPKLILSIHGSGYKFVGG
ncbi:MAG: response regulator transcription factor [Fibrobacterota bacterium]|nr:response regulator transcription factor [Fibrobacterota bacterium]